MARRKRAKYRLNGRDLGYGTPNGGMVRNQLMTIRRDADALIKMLEPDDEVPGWVASKVATSEDRIAVTRDYIESKLERMGATSFFLVGDREK